MSVADQHRRAEALKVWRHWTRLPDARGAHAWTEEEYRIREKAALDRLEELCQHEIGEAFEELGITRRSGENAKCASEGVRHAARTAAQGHNRDICEHVKVCVKDALQARIEAFSQVFYEAKAEELLRVFLLFPLPAVEQLALYLTQSQRSEMIQLLFRQLGARLVAPRMDVEPQERRLWLFWFLYRLALTEPETKRLLGGMPRTVLCYRDPLPVNERTGLPLNPLGPVYAKVWMQLGGELNKHDNPIKDPQSKSRLAKSLGVSRRTVDKYLADDNPVRIKPDGNGGVVFELDRADILRSIETVRGKKRGRKPKNS